MSSVSAANFPQLLCPIDGLPLSDPSDGWLRCGNGHRYSNRLHIPRILESENNYADGFGEQWKHFRTTQLDSHSKITISRDRLYRCLGDDLVELLGQDGRIQVLEAGCGAGRFTEVLLRFQAAVVTSTDLSSAVEPNQENFAQSDRHRIVQCDINAFPFAPEQYDLVVCLGVVQHTKSPEETIESLYEQVKPGGSLVIDHYTHMLSRYTKISANLLRPILKRLPAKQGMAVTEKITNAFFPLHRAAKHSRLAQVLLSRISPLATYYHTIPELDDRQQYEWALLDTHDGLTDYYKRLRTGQQLRRALATLGAEDIHVAKGGNGIEVRCRRPV